MRIRSLWLKNFRKFEGPVVVRGFGPGVNVLAERNEFGKSTLLAAINGVVFQRYKAWTEEVRGFQHLRHQAAPEVRLELEVGGAGWSIEKKFTGANGKALLVGPGGQRFENDAAEKRLQELLGLGAGARSVEAGIWGTLWVRQGQSFGVPDLDERSVRTIQDCLALEVGAVAGGRRGQKIPAAVEEQLAQLKSQRTLRGRYKEAKERRDVVEAEVAELSRRRAQLDDWLEKLAEKRAALERRKAQGDEAQLRDKRRLAAEERSRAMVWAAETESAASALRVVEKELEAARREQDDRRARVARLGRLAEDEALVAREIGAAEARVAELDRAIAECEAQLEGAREGERLTDEAERRWRRTRDAIEATARIERSRRALARSEQLEKELEGLMREGAGIAVTDKAVKAIAAASDELSAAEAALQAVATLVELSLEPGAAARVTVDGKAPPEEPLRVWGEAVIAIEGVGTIRVRPQISDRHRLIERQSAAAGELLRKLAEVRCPDLAAARAELARRKDLDARIKLLRGALDEESGAAGQGRAQLREALVADEARLEAELRALELTALPPLREVEESIAAAAVQLRERKAEAALLDKQLKVHAQSRATAQSQLSAAREKRRALVTERDGIDASLAAARSRLTDEDLSARVSSIAARVEADTHALAARREAAHESVEAVDDRLARLDEALDNHRKKGDELAAAIIELGTRVEENEGAGIEEELESRRAELARLDEQLGAFATEVEVLTLLSEVLREAERAAAERYLAPVVARVEPYLRTLLPQARLAMSPDDFRVTAIERGEFAEELPRLSDGTREQIAVLTRLAFAETLLAQGRPAMVILDDALVFSDDERMDRMFDILRRAGRRMQILVLTCRERVFEQLGGTHLTVEEEQVPRMAGG